MTFLNGLELFLTWKNKLVGENATGFGKDVCFEVYGQFSCHLLTFSEIFCMDFAESINENPAPLLCISGTLRLQQAGLATLMT